MYKRLFQIAAIFSPLMAMMGALPIYLVEHIDFSFFINRTVGLSIIFFIFWSVNILLLKMFKNKNSVQRFFVSFILVGCVHFLFLYIGNTFFPVKPSINIIYPSVAVLPINLLINIMIYAVLIHHEKKEAELLIEQLNSKNLEAQKIALIQQLQPHFLFNTLSTLKSLINENVTLAEAYTVKLAEFLRYTVQHSNADMVLLASELKFTTDYMDLQKVRFGNALHYDVHVSKDFYEQKIPIYALQTLIENAIKHNAFTEKKPLYIKIETQITLEANKIKVSNNKIPKQTNDIKGIGLENLSKRYALIANADVQIDDTSTDFTVYINLL